MNFKIFFFILLSASFTKVSVLSAAESNSRAEYVLTGTLPQMRLNLNRELELVFARDKIAVVSFAENKIKQIEIGMKKSDSTCEQVVSKIKCKMKMWFNFYNFQPIWKTHPDAKKIGKVLTNNSGGTITTVFVTDWSLKFMKPQNPIFLFSEGIQGAEPIQISCENMKWLGTADKIDELSFEMFSTSRETDLNENKTIHAFRDVTFTRQDGQLFFKDMKPYSRPDELNIEKLAAPLSAEVLGVTIQNKGKVCKYTFDRSTSSNLVRQYALEKMSTYKPLQFTSVAEATRILTQQSHEEMNSHNRHFTKVLSGLPEVIQVLDVFGLVHVRIHSLKNSQFEARITAGDIQ